jgi:hypothetical protein
MELSLMFWAGNGALACILGWKWSFRLCSGLEIELSLLFWAGNGALACVLGWKYEKKKQ